MRSVHVPGCLKRLPLLVTVVWFSAACRRAEVQKPVEASDQSIPATAATSSPQIAKKNLHAPGGVLFLLERVSITTDSGVIGFASGTRVRFVGDKGGTLRVSDGTTSFDVPANKLTDDVRIGALAGRQDAESQRALADYMRQQNEAYRAAREADKTWMDEQDRRVAARRQAAAEAIAHRANPLDRGSYNQTYSYPYWYPYWDSYGYRHGYPGYVDQFGQRYWIDSYGQKHHVP